MNSENYSTKSDCKNLPTDWLLLNEGELEDASHSLFTIQKLAEILREESEGSRNEDLTSSQQTALCTAIEILAQGLSRGLVGNLYEEASSASLALHNSLQH